MLLPALGLHKLNFRRSAHVSLLNESLPFPASLSVSSVSVLLPPLYLPPSLRTFTGLQPPSITMGGKRSR